jgi:hypothetical protein
MHSLARLGDTVPSLHFEHACAAATLLAWPGLQPWHLFNASTPETVE